MRAARLNTFIGLATLCLVTAFQPISTTFEMLETEDVAHSLCTARVMLVMDRTYSGQTLRMVAKVKEFMLGFVNNVDFASARVGLINVLPHTTVEQVNIDNFEASRDRDILLEHAETVEGGWRNMDSQFWTLFTDISQKVARVGYKSYIVLVSDGRLRDGFRWEQHSKLKEVMKDRLKESAPSVLCVRVGAKATSKFLKSICDKIVWEGLDGFSLGEWGANLGESICI